jgi:hypothetical protein
MVLTQLKAADFFGSLLLPTTIALWLNPASLMPEKQRKPSEIAVVRNIPASKRDNGVRNFVNFS